MLVFASMPAWVTRALRRCSGTLASAIALAGGRVEQQRRVVPGGQAQFGAPLAQAQQFR